MRAANAALPPRQHFSFSGCGVERLCGFTETFFCPGFPFVRVGRHFVSALDFVFAFDVAIVSFLVLWMNGRGDALQKNLYIQFQEAVSNTDKDFACFRLGFHSKKGGTWGTDA